MIQVFRTPSPLWYTQLASRRQCDGLILPPIRRACRASLRGLRARRFRVRRQQQQCVRTDQRLVPKLPPALLVVSCSSQVMTMMTSCSPLTRTPRTRLRLRRPHQLEAQSVDEGAALERFRDSTSRLTRARLFLPATSGPTRRWASPQTHPDSVADAAEGEDRAGETLR